ncbi:MraY family glycosyltransferase [Candidatus Symbiobacter mobilis]|uniref:UDP-N-acetylmuramyl pentapeptide phosphotransferase-like protein n=1 Tax=Candidatus Symbiobacter mobilis CR TaxID=946483 RepID=U5N4G9_9BURK|nr:glycosyltransferase [Candidatus Symbiobacter mobilis]AGX86155.1 UDP-N-acetylmuramyl pentapeptide phosphotransferase-like protein [Candidatus Symbiobacter mobilis CR]
MSVNLLDEPAVVGSAVTFLASVFVLLTRGWHAHFTGDFTHGVQKVHTHPTPRIGGVPIAIGLVLAWALVSEQVQALLGPMLIAGVPAFLFGLAEDLTKRVGVLVRLLATMGSGVLAWWLTDISITRVDIWGVDTMLAWLPASILFTAIAVGGVANAVNIIDGFNGLASSMLVIAAVGFGSIAYQFGDLPLTGICVVLAACTLGFFCVNWPFGKIFLGDGGSYLLGFGLAWVAVLLMHRHPTVSAFAVLMVCVHPVTEVLFSMYRRKMRKTHVGMPDRLHFHSLLGRRVVRHRTAHLPPLLRNSTTGIAVGMMSIPPVIVALWVHQSTFWSATALLGFVLAYLTLYARMVRFAWRSPLALLTNRRMRD